MEPHAATAALPGPPDARAGVHILVAAGPPPVGPANFAPELRLLKAAVLYGDRVTLYSPEACAARLAAETARPPAGGRAAFLERRLVVLQTVEQIEVQRRFIALVRALEMAAETAALATGPDGEAQRRAATAALAQVDDVLQKAAAPLRDTLSDGRYLELEAALNSGLVTLREPVLPGVGAPAAELARSFARAVSEEYARAVLEALLLGGPTYPLLDARTVALLNRVFPLGAAPVPAGTQQRARSVALAAALFDRLPTFEHAPLDEVLDIRRALDGPLVRFRAAMLRLSGTLAAATWDADFPAEADLLVTREIAPQLADIEQGVRDNRLLGPALRAVVDKATPGAVSGGIGFAIAHAGHLPDVVAAAVGGLTAAAPGVYDALQAWRERRATIARHDLYFYHRVGHELG